MADVLADADRAFEDADASASELADQLAAALGHGRLRADVHAVVHAYAHGAGRVVVTPVMGEELSPNEAAEALGVSRKLVESLMAEGRLRYRRLPGSSHRKIPASDVAELAAEQRYVREGVDEIVDALADAEY
jgi:excisionase family DNA binding protein